ncbi:MAG: hypothetical protein ACK551_08775 [Vampirovibrionales bacterium]
MSMISQYNPEYDAKPWLNKTVAKPLTASGGQLAPVQEPVFTTLSINENGGGVTLAMGENGSGLPPIDKWNVSAPGENGSGLPPIDYSLPKDFTGFGENGLGLPPIQTMAIPENGGGGAVTLAIPENGGGKGWSPIPKDPVFTTMAIPENGGRGRLPIQTMRYPENGGGYAVTQRDPENGGVDLPIYRKPKPRIVYNFPPMQTMSMNENGGGIVTTLAFPENGGGSSVDPYAMVQNPWMSNSPRTAIKDNPFWGV